VSAEGHARRLPLASSAGRAGHEWAVTPPNASCVKEAVVEEGVMNTLDSEEDLTDLLGKMVGKLEEKTLTLHMLVALLEEKGILRPGEVDHAVSAFLRERGRDYFVGAWGESMGEGLYEGLALKELT
jgi:hypothetical protein